MSAPADAERDDRVAGYLEAYATAGLNREVAQEEAVWSAMPLFLTAVGLLATALGTLLLKLPVSELSPFNMGGYAAGLVATTYLGTGLFHIERAILPRRYRYPPDEEKLCAWVETQRTFHAGQGRLTGAQLENAVMRDLKAHVLGQLSVCATNNRANNHAKQHHRTKAIRRIFVSGLATLALAAIVLSYNVNTAIMNAGHLNERRTATPAAAAAAPATPAPATAAPRVGMDREGAHDAAEDKVEALGGSRPGPPKGGSGAPQQGAAADQ